MFCYRNWKYEQELASLLWKIDYKDINFREQYGGGSVPLTGTMGRVSNRDPVDQSIVSLTSSLRGQLVMCFTTL